MNEEEISNVKEHFRRSIEAARARWSSQLFVDPYLSWADGVSDIFRLWAKEIPDFIESQSRRSEWISPSSLLEKVRKAILGDVERHTNGFVEGNRLKCALLPQKPRSSKGEKGGYHLTRRACLRRGTVLLIGIPRCQKIKLLKMATKALEMVCLTGNALEKKLQATNHKRKKNFVPSRKNIVSRYKIHPSALNVAKQGKRFVPVGAGHKEDDRGRIQKNKQPLSSYTNIFSVRSGSFSFGESERNTPRFGRQDADLSLDKRTIDTEKEALAVSGKDRYLRFFDSDDTPPCERYQNKDRDGNEKKTLSRRPLTYALYTYQEGELDSITFCDFPSCDNYATYVDVKMGSTEKRALLPRHLGQSNRV